MDFGVSELLLSGECMADSPDFRDRTLATKEAESISALINSSQNLATEVDLSERMPGMTQEQYCGTAANACCTLMEYFRGECFGNTDRLSREFLHSTTSVLYSSRNHIGTSLRTVLKSLARNGVPPHSLVTRLVEQGKQAVDSPLCYQFNDYVSGFSYYRISLSDCQTAISKLKMLLAAGIPTLISMAIPRSALHDCQGGRIDVRLNFDSIVGMAAGVLCGFDDNFLISQRGAFHFCGPFPKTWGCNGFGWLSYQMFEQQMISDVWVAMSDPWIAHLTSRLSTWPRAKAFGP